MQITNVRTHSPRAGGGNDNALPEHNIESSLVVCFDPESGQIAELSLCPLCAITRHQRATSHGRLPAPSRSADSTVTPSNRLLRPQGDGCWLATLSQKVGASAEEEINEPTGKFLRPRGDMMRLKLLASAVVS